MSKTTTCNHPGCNNPRWYGPKGTNTRLYKCEQHQREEWVAIKRRYPKPSKGAVLEDGTQRKVGRPKKDAPKPYVAPEPLTFSPSTMPAPRPAIGLVKVVVVNHSTGMVQLVEAPVVWQEAAWSKVSRPEALVQLLRGCGYVVVDTEKDFA